MMGSLRNMHKGVYEGDVVTKDVLCMKLSEGWTNLLPVH